MWYYVLSSGTCLHAMTTIALRTYLHGILSHMVSAWHLFPCPDPRLFSMCHLIVNPICFPNVPYDVPTVSHGHICSIQSYLPYMICNMFLMMFPKFPLVIHLCSLIVSNMFRHMFLIMFPNFSYVIYSCSLIFRQYVFPTCSLCCSQ